MKRTSVDAPGASAGVSSVPIAVPPSSSFVLEAAAAPAPVFLTVTTTVTLSPCFGFGFEVVMPVTWRSGGAAFTVTTVVAVSRRRRHP